MLENNLELILPSEPPRPDSWRWGVVQDAEEGTVLLDGDTVAIIVSDTTAAYQNGERVYVKLSGSRATIVGVEGGNGRIIYSTAERVGDVEDAVDAAVLEIDGVKVNFQELEETLESELSAHSDRMDGYEQAMSDYEVLIGQHGDEITAFKTELGEGLVAVNADLAEASAKLAAVDATVEARAVTAARGVFVPGNQYRDPKLTERAGWGALWQPTGGYRGGGSIHIPAGSGQRGAHDLQSVPAGFVAQDRTQVEAGREYRVGAWVKPSGAVTGEGVSIHARFYNSNGSEILPYKSFNSGALSAGKWTFVEGAVKAPTSAAYMVLGCFCNAAYTGSAVFSDLYVAVKASAVLIENGAVTADKIVSGAVTADKIGANAVTAGKIAANAVTAGNIAAGAVTSDTIASKAVLAGNIAAGVIASQHIDTASIAADVGNYLSLNATNIYGVTATFTDAIVKQLKANRAYIGWITSSMIEADVVTANELRLGSVSIDAAALEGVLSLGDTYMDGESIGIRGVFKVTNAGHLQTPRIEVGPDASSYGRRTVVTANDYGVPQGVYLSDSANASRAMGVYRDPDASYTIAIRGGDGSSNKGAVKMFGQPYFPQHGTTSSVANAFLNSSSGGLTRSTSLRKYKKHIRDLVVNEESYLSMPGRDWFDKAQVEENGGSTEGLHRIPGLVVEDLQDIGMEQFITYDDVTGEPIGVAYDRAWVPLLGIVKRQKEQIAALEERLSRIEDSLTEVKK